MRLLIADDEKITRNVLMNYIPWSEMGITKIEQAKDGKEALEIALRFHPDIVLSDIRMPKMNGLEFAGKLKAEQEDCRFIFLSAYSDRGYLKQAIHLRAVNYVEKPIKLDEIQAAVQEAIQEIRSRHKITYENYYRYQKKLCMNLLTDKAKIAEGKDLLFFSKEDSSYLAAEMRLYVQDESIGTEYEESVVANHLQALLIEKLTAITQEESGEECLRRYCLYAVKDPEHVIVLFRLKDGLTDRSCFKIADQIRTELLDQMPQIRRVLVGLGPVVTSIAEMNHSYHQAKRNRRKSFLTGTIRSADQKSSGNYDFGGKLPTDTLAIWKQGERTEMELSLKHLAKAIREHSETPATAVRNYYLKLLMTLVQRAENYNNIGFIDMSGAYMEALGQTCCLDEISICMEDAARYYFCSKESGSQFSHIADKVTDFVLNHFEDEKLSISFIAGKMYLSPNYLSLLFKKETGKTINQFITEVRMNKAKELLKKDNALLSSISRQVGYHDAMILQICYCSVKMKRREPAGCQPHGCRP